RNAARGVAEQVARFAIDRLHLVGRSFAGAQAPAILVVADVAARVDARIGALYVHGATAVLEVVAALLPHEAVADSAEVDPRVRELVDEQWPGVQEAVAVDVLPLVGAGPGAVAILADRMRGRAQRQHVEHDRLAVAFPAVVQESALGL